MADDRGISAAENLLTVVQAHRQFIEDFSPLGMSLEWHLGQQYFRSRGTKAFISDSTPVPFIINNDGTFVVLAEMMSRNRQEIGAVIHGLNAHGNRFWVSA